MDKHLYRLVQSGHLILTVNDRLSRTLSRQFDVLQQSKGLKAWLRPEIMSFNAWMIRTHADISAPPMTLNKAQLLHTWEMVIEEDVRNTDYRLLQLPQTARKAMQAHHLLVRYSVEFDEGKLAEDHKAFLRWRTRWLAKAAEHHWHDPVELPGMLVKAIKSGDLDSPEKVVLAGFDDFTPDIRLLLDAMAEQGAKVEEWHPAPYGDNSCSRVRANDMREEVKLCARWVRHALVNNPEAHIGVVAPQLEAYLSHIENVFCAELTPEDYAEGHETQKLFNVSLGSSLDREGVVHAALKLLKISSRISQADISWLFNSPYISNAMTECHARALADCELRKTKCSEWTLNRLMRTIQATTQKKSLNIDGLEKCLTALAASLNRSKSKALPGEWAETFVNLLHKLGWPGDRGLSSREYQATKHFRNVLGEFASLDGVAGKLQRAEAVRILSRMVTSHEFQAEGVDDVPVQVLGELESAGMTFDHLWVLGLHEEALPRSPSPNPFIPVPLQKTFQMQRADVEREYLYAQKLAGRLFEAAPEVIASWPRQENGTELRPSTFIKDLPVVESFHLAETHMPASKMWELRPTLNEQIDSAAPPLSSRKPFSGGTGIIKDQALCPFRAFAHYRLHAAAMETPEIGIDNLTRGGLAHKALELFWSRVVDQSTLLSLEAESFEQYVHKAVSDSLDDRYDLPERQRQIERNRLKRIVLQWLDIERQRKDFKVVESEQSHLIQVGALTIRTRIDRVDELDDGRQAIIDYKTGRPDPAQWLEDRITEPQLPLYSLNVPDKNIGAVMFAEVRSKENECGFRGVARSEESWPRAKSRKLVSILAEKELHSFDDILKHWHRVLAELGDEFSRGVASVSPVDRETACQYCDLTVLCRVLEQDLHDEGGADV